MKYDRFENLPVWKSAMDLAARIYAHTRDCFYSQPGDLRDQIRRAALSVSNNIAEGFERGSTAELIAFLYIARGSAGEVRSMLHFVERLTSERQPAENQSPERQSVGSELIERTSVIHLPAPTPPKSGISNLRSEISNFKSQISDFNSEISNLISLSESCSRQIRAWTEHLQNTEIKGQRHLNDKTRGQYESKQRAEEFQQHIQKILHDSRPDIYPEPKQKT